MRWIKLKHKIRLNPSILDPYRARSHRQAKQAWRKQGRPTKHTVMDIARRKGQYSIEQWENLTGYRLGSKRPLISSNTKRRLVVALTAVILLAAFLTCTVPGRTLAYKVQQFYTKIVNRVLYLYTLEASDIESIPQATSTSSFQNSVLGFASPGYLLISQKTIRSNVTGNMAISEYSFDGCQIVLTQRWPLSNQHDIFQISLGDSPRITVNTTLGLSIEGAYTEHDKTFVGISLSDDIWMQIVLIEVTSSEIEAILNNLEYIDAISF